MSTQASTRTVETPVDHDTGDGDMWHVCYTERPDVALCGLPLAVDAHMREYDPTATECVVCAELDALGF